MLLFQYIFKIPADTMRYWYPRIMIPLVILVALGYTLYQRRFYKELHALVEQYFDKDKEAFLRENLALLEKTKNKSRRALCQLNTSAAYAGLERFEDAKNMLESTDEEALPGANRYVRIVNLIYSYFRLNEEEKAFALLDQHRERLLAMQKRGVMLGQSINVNFIYELVLRGTPEEGRKLLQEIKEKDPRPLFDEDIYTLEQLLEKR